MELIIHLCLLVTSPAIHGSRVGTAQDETFAIVLGTFLGLAILMLFWLRSGHERARREVVSRQQAELEQSRTRSRVLDAHEPEPRYGEDVPR